jgi:hypothetical protein
MELRDAKSDWLLSKNEAGVHNSPETATIPQLEQSKTSFSVTPTMGQLEAYLGEEDGDHVATSAWSAAERWMSLN